MRQQYWFGPKNSADLDQKIQLTWTCNKRILLPHRNWVRRLLHKLLNRSFFINRSGKIVNYYDKIHLFDVNINNKEIHRESQSFHKGNKVVCINSPWGKIGLTICYDIRFPDLYRNLTKQGAKIILVPAAFTVPTGKDHWEILLRSRAIENTSFIIEIIKKLFFITYHKIHFY